MVTERFCISQRTLLATLFMLHGRVSAIVSGVAVAVLIAVSVIAHDVRWAICALMVLFIVWPMTMAFLYINYALDPECAYNALPHTLELLPDGVKIVVFPRDAGANDGIESGRVAEDLSNEDSSGAKAHMDMAGEDLPVVERMVSYEKFRPMYIASRGVMYPCGRGFLFLPRSAFVNNCVFEEFSGRISDSIKCISRK